MFIRPKGESARFRRYRYGPGGIRLILPCVAVAAGLASAAIGGAGLASGHSTAAVMLACGLGLAALGVVFFLLALWMGKRGI